MIKVNGLTYRFGERIILKDLCLSVTPNSFHTILGLNGVGKSLTLRLISGLEVMQNGAIDRDSKSVSFVFQKPNFYPWLSIRENLEISSKLSRKSLEALFKRWHLDEYSEMYPSELSGGTLQKVNILRAFMQNPDLILMDEPFSQLDIIQKEEFYGFTKELLIEYKTTVVLVTHDIDEAIYLSTNISYLSKKEKNITNTLSIEMEKELDFYSQKTVESHLNYSAQIFTFFKSDFLI